MQRLYNVMIIDSKCYFFSIISIETYNYAR